MTKKKSTKQKILEAALKLFNQDGLVNVRLQHIADEAFISVGNLAYHFSNKEAIVMGLYDELTKKQKELLADYRVVPLFNYFDHLIRRSFDLQQVYIFFYLDTLEVIRAYDSIAEIHRKHIDWQISQLKNMLAFNVSRGALKEEPMEGVFERLATQLWMTLDLWMAQQFVRGKKEYALSDYREAIWTLIVPYFTDMGRREFVQMWQLPYDFYL